MQRREQWEREVREQARKDGWWRPAGAVVAAVSGGPDSMALLHLLKTMAEEAPFRLVAAHVNHRFRGAESDAEAELVRRVAAEWGVPCACAAIDVPAYIAETGMNAQAAAREKRYAFLTGTARQHACDTLLLAHHADDQAETVLMRILRGTGPGGLAGISRRRTEKGLELIRPLLRITKYELLEYCKRNGVPYAVDSSNADSHYFRNAVRLETMPMLEAHNPRLREALARLAEMTAADEDYMEAAAREVFDRAAKPAGDGFRLERRRFRSLHAALQRRLIKLILSCSSNPRETAQYRHVDAVVSALERESPTVVRLELGSGWELNREYEEAYIGPAVPRSLPYHYFAGEATDEIRIAETGDTIRFRLLEGAWLRKPESAHEAFFDPASLRYPLQVRSRLPGDILQPDGLNGTKKVQDMFVDAKVPGSRRDRMAHLTDGDGRLLWIPGLRRSGHALVTPDTRNTLRVELLEAGRGESDA